MYVLKTVYTPAVQRLGRNRLTTTTRRKLCTIVVHSTALNISGNLPPYPPDKHHSSDGVYRRAGGKERNEDSRIQVQLEEDGGSTAAAKDRAERSLWPMFHSKQYTIQLTTKNDPEAEKPLCLLQSYPSLTVPPSTRVSFKDENFPTMFYPKQQQVYPVLSDTDIIQ